MSPPVITPRAVARFADGLLGDELPDLDAHRRRDAVDFIASRVRGLSSFTRFGVTTIASVVDTVGAVVGHDRVRDLVVRLPLPLVAEYPRLVRSLGFAYVWETWPDTTVAGGRPR